MHFKFVTQNCRFGIRAEGQCYQALPFTRPVPHFLLQKGLLKG